MSQTPWYLHELNKLFEPPKKSTLAQPEDDLDTYDCSRSDITSPSPASSTATLALDEEQIEATFSLEKSRSIEGIFTSDIFPNSTMLSRRNSLLMTDELNPFATPFIPNRAQEPYYGAEVTPKAIFTVTPTLTLLPRPGWARKSPVPPLPQKPEWFLAFTDMTNPSTPIKELDILARDFIISRSWDTDTIKDLAQEFARKGCQNITERHDSLGFISLSVCRWLSDTYGDSSAKYFMWHLGQTSISNFIERWDVESPAPISYAFAPSPAYVASSISLASFTGDLFAHELISRVQVTACLSALLKDLSAIEQVQATHRIITHAGPVLWHYPPGLLDPLDNFVLLFTQKTSFLREHMSVLNKPLQPDMLGKRIDQIAEMALGWRAALIPAPQPWIEEEIVSLDCTLEIPRGPWENEQRPWDKIQRQPWTTNFQSPMIHEN